MAAAARKVRTAPALTWPELLPLLQQHFALTTIYDRELDGRVVATRFDPATHTVVDVTDFELAWARLFSAPLDGHGGGFRPRIRRTWYWTAADGSAVHFNPQWELCCRHLGVQYASRCVACGATRWNNADRPPLPRCRDCRAVTSGRCPALGLACSSAYRHRGCRCAACAAWKRASRGRGGDILSTKRQEELQATPSPTSGHRTNNVPTPFAGFATLSPEQLQARVALLDPDNWTWLPAEVRTVLGDYEVAVQAVVEAEEAAAAAAGEGSHGQADRGAGAALGEEREAHGRRRAGADGAQRWAQERAQQVPRRARRLQADVPVLLARGPVAADGTRRDYLDGIGLVRIVVA